MWTCAIHPPSRGKIGMNKSGQKKLGKNKKFVFGSSWLLPAL